MSRPEISVIIPYYNAVRHIERAARSLFGQSLGRRLETVWVDDGSTDGSAALLHSILSEKRADAPSAITLTHSNNRGSAAARLTGLSAASGRYIIFCDADDYVDNDAYETMLHTACTTGADMVVCDYIVERGDSRVRHTGMRDSRSLTSDMLRGKVHAGLWNKLIARHLFDSIGPLWIEGIDMWEDAWITTRAAYHAKKTAYLPRPLYHYVSNPQSYTGRVSDKSISDMLDV
ncbi:MAG: glycosyltransferase, partial [Paramuribaculum intestinale]